MRKVLVTGGAGFIGSNFVRYLLNSDQDVEIVNLDALTYAGSLENLNDLPNPDRHQFVKGDVNDKELIAGLLSENAVDTIVHFAAETHVDRSIANADQFLETNVQGTLRLLQAAREYWLEGEKDSPNQVRFHHISTDEVYGSLSFDEPAWTERSPYAPNSPYAATKAASDHLVRAYGHTHGLPFTITTCSNNYGPHQYPEKLIPLVIANALKGEKLPIYGDGKNIRDWIFVRDHCRAIDFVLSRGVPGETYNIGGGNQPSNVEVVEMVCEILDRLKPDSPFCPHHQLIEFVSDRPGHDLRYALNAEKIKRKVGWKPTYGLEEGLTETVKWYLDHPHWLKKMVAKRDAG